MPQRRRPDPSIEAARERRAREQRERERRRAAMGSGGSAPATRPRPARQRPAKPMPLEAVAARPVRRGLFGALADGIANLPALLVAVLRGFALEVLAVLGGVGRFLLRLVPGGRQLGRVRAVVAVRARGALAEAPVRASARVARPAAEGASRRRPRTEAQQRAWERRRELLRARLRVALAIGVAISAVLAWIYVPASDAFRIRHVEVSGAHNVGDLEARERIDSLLRGRTVFTVDEDRVARELEELPFVREARVERHLPGGLELHLLEYRPLALGYGDGHFWLIARDGRILSKARRQEWLGRVPVVSLDAEELEPGMRVTDEPAMQVLAVRPPGSTLAIESVAFEDGALAARLENGVDVRFGRPELLAQKLLVAEEMLRRSRRDKLGELVYIDVTVPSKPAVCPRTSSGCLMARKRDRDEAKAATAARAKAAKRAEDAAAGEAASTDDATGGEATDRATDAA